MTTIQDLTGVLKKLRLSGVLQTMELREQQAVDDNLTHRDFLFAVLHDEVERREAKQLSLRLRRASFDSQRTIEDFDFAFNPRIPKAKVIDLATCNFVERHDNVLLVGPTGVGKSHLAQALGNRACRAGHSVLYLSAHEMLSKLRASRADGSYDPALELKYSWFRPAAIAFVRVATGLDGGEPLKDLKRDPVSLKGLSTKVNAYLPLKPLEAIGLSSQSDESYDLEWRRHQPALSELVGSELPQGPRDGFASAESIAQLEQWFRAILEEN